MKDDRNCTHCGGRLVYKGLKEIHEGQPSAILLGKMACDAYVCNKCGHIEFFYPSEPTAMG